MKQVFRKLAKRVAEWTGSASAFLIAFAAVIVWAITGPIFHYSENWQLIINTGSSIITFLMVFLIQNQQNRESAILHLKIDELIRTNKKARNDLINLDEHTDEELAVLHDEFRSLKEDTDARIDSLLKKTKREPKPATGPALAILEDKKEAN